MFNQPLPLLAALLLLLAGCHSASLPNSDADDPTFRKPTAAEVFNLRSKCAELGEKIMDQNLIGSALAQDQVSHYDPKTNRCYVELDVHMADLTKYEDFYARYLYDGQTGEMLAWTRSQKGVKAGFVKDESMLKTTFDSADVRIDTLMADDRKR